MSRRKGKKRVSVNTFADRLRKRATPEEIALHAALRVALEPYRSGLCFQHPIGPFVADFCFTCVALVIELDGAHHYTPEGIARDKNRDDYLRFRGFKVVRYPNKRVRNDLLGLVHEIVAMCGEMSLKTDPVEITKLPPGEAVNIRKDRIKREKLVNWFASLK